MMKVKSFYELDCAPGRFCDRLQKLMSVLLLQLTARLIAVGTIHIGYKLLLFCIAAQKIARLKFWRNF
jgi:hypothetical protein